MRGVDVPSHSTAKLLSDNPCHSLATPYPGTPCDSIAPQRFTKLTYANPSRCCSNLLPDRPSHDHSMLRHSVLHQALATRYCAFRDVALASLYNSVANQIITLPPQVIAISSPSMATRHLARHCNSNSFRHEAIPLHCSVLLRHAPPQRCVAWHFET